MSKTKKWIDANEIAQVAEIPRKLYKYDDLMKEIPNYDKQKNNNNNGARRIFQRKEYSIYKADSGYIIHNTNKKFEVGHTHVKSFIKAKSIVDLCVRKKLPTSTRKWEIESLIRITNNNTYKNKLRSLLESIKY